MNPNIRFQEVVAVLATLDSASVAASTVVTAYVPLANFHGVAALIDIGVFGTSATVNASLLQAQDTSGTGSKAITGKAITQLAAAGGNGKQVIIECRGEDLDVSNGFNTVALSITVGTAATQLAAFLLGVNPRYADVATYNQAGVAQLV